MASEGKNTNRSQFFFTLGACEYLNKKHTLFGKITGDTLFNLRKFEEIEFDGEESDAQPLYPPRIQSTEVLVNTLSLLAPYPAKEKQALLEAPDLKTRADVLVALTEMALARGTGGPRSRLQ